jgi:Cu-Zn family superoxide dismutase
MPALFFTQDGAGAMSFITDRFDPAEIVGRAVILHAAPDNYGNVPVGPAANQYTPNAPDATTLTQNTGNAGNRIACGVIQ